MKDHIQEAIADLADEALGRQFDTDVRIEDALAYVDEALAQKWLARQLCSQLAQGILIEVIEKRFSEATGKDLLAGLLNSLQRSNNSLPHDCAALAGKTLAAALRQHIAADLQYDAQKRVDNYEPSDSEMSRDFYPHVPDDPVSRDRSALARNYNASLRAARVSR